jgi:hypothetical protein
LYAKDKWLSVTIRAAAGLSIQYTEAHSKPFQQQSTISTSHRQFEAFNIPNASNTIASVMNTRNKSKHDYNKCVKEEN